MSIPEMVLLAATLVLALGASWMLVAPFFSDVEQGAGAKADSAVALRETLRRKEMLLESLEDLELERNSGKVSQEDYEITKAELNKETAACLALLDSLQVDDTRRSA